MSQDDDVEVKNEMRESLDDLFCEIWERESKPELRFAVAGAGTVRFEPTLACCLCLFVVVFSVLVFLAIQDVTDEIFVVLLYSSARSMFYFPSMNNSGLILDPFSLSVSVGTARPREFDLRLIYGYTSVEVDGIDGVSLTALVHHTTQRAIDFIH